MPILPAVPSDVAGLVGLVNSAYRGMEGVKGWTHESHLLEGPRTDADGILELMNEPGSVILKYLDAAGELLGCVCLQREGELLYLGLLGVLPGFQGGGVGKALLAVADEYAVVNRCVRIRITVISVRRELVAWYERHGYVRTGEIEPFHAGERFGVQKQPLELVVLEKTLVG